MLRLKLLIVLISFYVKAVAQDTVFIKVHFLYGSKPKKEFKHIEQKWFGGKLGGHVGIEVDSDKVIDFNPSGKFHYVAKRKNRHSKFYIHSSNDFWNIFEGPPGQLKKTTIVVPISLQQKQELDSLVTAYSAQTPYDYAFIGMRCGAATYDILARLDIVKQYSYRRTYLKIFYPKKLRKRLLKKAEENSWTIIKEEGSSKRKWEKD